MHWALLEGYSHFTLWSVKAGSYLDSTGNAWKWPETHKNAKFMSVQCPPPLWGSPAEQLALSLEEFAGRELCAAVEGPFVTQLHAAC